MTLRIRLENFEGVLLASVWFNIHVAMLQLRSTKLFLNSTPAKMFVWQVVSDQLQLGSFLPTTWELEEREHGNEVVSVL